jgi:hypothetical protein
MSFAGPMVVNGFNNAMRACYGNVRAMSTGRQLSDQVAGPDDVDRSDVGPTDFEFAELNGRRNAANKCHFPSLFIIPDMTFARTTPLLIALMLKMSDQLLMLTSFGVPLLQDHLSQHYQA